MFNVLWNPRGVLFYLIYFAYHLQMSSSKIPVSDIRGKLEKEIQLQRRDLEKKRLDTNQKSDESIRILSEKLSEKKKELNGCSWIQCNFY